MWNWIGKLAELTAEGAPVAIVTVTRCSGSTPRETGAKMLVLPQGEFFGTIGGGALEQEVLQEARRCLAEGTSRTLHYPLHASVGQCCGGVVELLVEVVNQGPSLHIFGAGHVGRALCKTLQDTAFQVHLVDERAEWLHSSELPTAAQRHADWKAVIEERGKPGGWDAKNSYVVIMTHEHDLDFDILSRLLGQPLRYLGMIGSQSKWKSFQARLTKAGATPEQIARIHCPMGLPTGGKAPQEIAISIAAELLQTHYEP
ncbi:MAG: xanthine dehydrogenase accessory protein XdhC [Oligoflexia bacterium]|nr:xanthine dehydrogenase accessory protein XdhC [Oligoflexia bacterium]